MIIDIQHFDESKVSSAETFLVDTNILLYLHRPQTDKKEIAGKYSTFVNGLRRIGCTLVVSSLHLQEALNVIDRTCWKRYRDSLKKSGSNKKIDRKLFRTMPEERTKVKSEQRTFLRQVVQFYEIKPESVSPDELIHYSDSLDKHYYDPVDFIIALHYYTFGIITDDQDFTHDTGIDTYTLIKTPT